MMLMLRVGDILYSFIFSAEPKRTLYIKTIIIIGSSESTIQFQMFGAQLWRSLKTVAYVVCCVR